MLKCGHVIAVIFLPCIKIFAVDSLAKNPLVICVKCAFLQDHALEIEEMKRELLSIFLVPGKYKSCSQFGKCFGAEGAVCNIFISVVNGCHCFFKSCSFLKAVTQRVG